MASKPIPVRQMSCVECGELREWWRMNWVCIRCALTGNHRGQLWLGQNKLRALLLRLSMRATNWRRRAVASVQVSGR